MDDTILVSLYAMGRMEGMWGKDYMEFQPERWVSEDRRLRYVLPYKFLAFNIGPRSCLGKDISIVHMKTVIAAVVWNFDMDVLEGQVVEQKLSVLLQMKNGIMVKAKK